MTVYPDDYLSCAGDVCEAKAGERCYTLLGRGPQALPSQFADRPHSARKVRGESRKPRAQSATPVRTDAPLPARRTARKTEKTAAAWLAKAKTKETI